jgi:hypothetical protein
MMKLKQWIFIMIGGVCWAGAMTVTSAPVILFDGLAEKGSITGWANVGGTGPQRIGPGASYEYTDLAYSTTIPKWRAGDPPNYVFSHSGALYDAGVRPESNLSTPPAYVRGQDIYAGYYLKWENVSSDSVTVKSLNFPLAFTPNPEGEYPATVQILGVVAPNENRAFINRTVNFAVLFKCSTPGEYRFDSSSSLKVTVRAWVPAVGNYTNRWVVVAGGVTYVSQTPVTGSMTGVFADYTLDNPDEIRWAVWTPGADLSFGNLTFNVAGNSINGITHAGIAENNVVRAGENDERRIYLGGLEADLAVCN